jgi:hypothetical protein
MAIPATPGVPLPARQAAYYREVRSLVQSLWASIYGLQDRQHEWDALDYGNTLIDAGDADGDLNGITAAELGSCVHGTADAMVAVLDAGHATNLAKLL